MSEVTGRELSAAEKRAQINRDNAFQDLANIVNKLQGPFLMVQTVDLCAVNPASPNGWQPAKVIIHHGPGQLSELIASLMHKEKQLEIAANVLTSMLLEKGLVDVVEFMDRCAKAAEETANVMRRGMLSQGAQTRIMKPS